MDATTTTEEPQDATNKHDAQQDQFTQFYCLTDHPDMVVIVGDGEERKRITVNSLHLIAAYKVFATMLGPKFKEGNDLKTANPAELYEQLLPEDDPETTFYAFAIFRHRVSDLPRQFTEAQLYALVIFASKYDCEAAMIGVVAYRWPPVLSWRNTTTVRDVKEEMKCLAAAYVFQMADHYMVYSNNIVCNHGVSFRELDEYETYDQLPAYVSYSLVELREAMRVKLAEIFGAYRAKRVNAYEQPKVTQFYGVPGAKFTTNTPPSIRQMFDNLALVCKKTPLEMTAIMSEFAQDLILGTAGDYSATEGKIGEVLNRSIDL